ACGFGEAVVGASRGGAGGGDVAEDFGAVGGAAIDPAGGGFPEGGAVDELFDGPSSCAGVEGFQAVVVAAFGVEVGGYGPVAAEGMLVVEGDGVVEVGLPGGAVAAGEAAGQGAAADPAGDCGAGLVAW
ncbi:MAG: hypothetical protein WBB07_08495, partial [Mycobacterium sp.]